MAASTGSVRLAKALYDFSYEDDHNQMITMKQGETYHLLNSEGEDWWHVKRPNTLASFYVPRTYVEIVDVNQISDDLQEEINDNRFTGSQGSIDQEDSQQTMQVKSESNDTKLHKNGLTTFKSPMEEENNDESLYINYNGGGKNVTSIQVQYLGKAQRPSDLGFGDGGEYANLDDLRAAAGMQPGGKGLDQSPDSDYANLQQLHIDPPSSPPLPDQSIYQKTIMAKWDMFLDPETNRVFYVHKDTKERNWKPPRDKTIPGTFHNEMYKQRSRSSGDYEEVLSPISPLESRFEYPKKNRKSRSLDYGRPIRIPTIVPEGWTYEITDEGNSVFINEATKQKWLSAVDECGRQYFYSRHGGQVESVWQLPNMRVAEEESPAQSPTEDILNPLPKSQSSNTLVDQRSLERSKVSDRFRKSRSVMIENLHFPVPPANNTGPPPPKSATLPPNFQTPEVVLHVDGVGSRKESRPEHHHHKPPFSQSCQLNEPIEGVIYKAKIEKGGRCGKKAQSYVKLEGTNLVFHQIHKKNKPGQIEYMVPLQTCKVEKNPKDISSKKNSILVSTEDPALQTLLIYEDEGKMQDWFLRLQMKIKEVGGPAEAPQEKVAPQSDVNRKPSFKRGKGHSRNDSRSDANVSKSSLKDFLQTFLTKRKNITEIQEKGIYKNAVFGAELKQVCEKDKAKVPTFVVRSVEAIEKRGLDHEGIYRIGGNVSQIQKLRCMVDQDEPYNLDDPVWDMNVLTGALKLFFRELKEPLFTYSLFDKFLSNYMKELNSERLKGIKSTMQELPKCHYETVKFLFKHLTKTMEASKENKMQAHQLAIVFGPTLIWPQVQSSNLATSMVYQSRIVEYVLLEYKNIFR